MSLVYSISEDEAKYFCAGQHSTPTYIVPILTYTATRTLTITPFRSLYSRTREYRTVCFLWVCSSCRYVIAADYDDKLEIEACGDYFINV